MKKLAFMPHPTIHFAAVLQRKDPRLPVYVVVPCAVIRPWKLCATAVVEGSVNGHALGRRSIKRWDASEASSWFVEFTAPFCKAAGIGVDDELKVSLKLVPDDVPEELGALFHQNLLIQVAWDRLSESVRRTTKEHIRAGKSAVAQERRAAVVVQRLRAGCA